VNNPVIAREFITVLRKKNSFLYLFIFLLFGTLAFISYWVQVSHFRYNSQFNQMIPARVFYHSFTGQLSFIAQILIAFLCGASINQEMNRGSWDLLRTTPINLLSILGAKVLAYVGFIGLLTVSLFPTFSTIMIMGSIGPSDILMTVLSFGEQLLLIGLIGMYASSRWQQPVRAIFSTFIIMFVYFFILPLAAQLIVAFIPFMKWIICRDVYPSILRDFNARHEPANRLSIAAQYFPSAIRAFRVDGRICIFARARLLQASALEGGSGSESGSETVAMGEKPVPHRDEADFPGLEESDLAERTIRNTGPFSKKTVEGSVAAGWHGGISDDIVFRFLGPRA